MTYRVAFTRRAQADLYGLFDYLADRFGLTNAQRYVEQIEKACLERFRIYYRLPCPIHSAAFRRKDAEWVGCKRAFGLQVFLNCSSLRAAPSYIAIGTPNAAD